MKRRIPKKTRGSRHESVQSHFRKSQSGVTSAATIHAAATIADITPPLEVGLLTSSVKETWAPFQSIRTPLKARVLFLEFGKERVALLSLDLLGLTGVAVGGWARFKRSLARATSLAPARIVITSTHTHNGPESVAITNLYRTKPFRLWLREMERKLTGAIKTAAAKTQPCTLSFADTELRGFSLQRRIPTPHGIVMSDSVQPIPPKLMGREPIDHRVRAISLHGQGGSLIATVAHAACHPVHEMCLPQISSDFPGEFCSALEASEEYGAPIFLNGAAGDINPPTVSGGADCARRHGQAMARVVTDALPEAQNIETDSIAFRRNTVRLPTRSLKGMSSGRCTAHLSALRFGPVALVFVPGEIFVETALAIERESPFARTLIVGFAESSIGYVPTRRAFREGGYEIGPGKWSFLQVHAEPILRRAVIKLLWDLTLIN